MPNNCNDEFKELERLNAQIDIWIDDEDYDKIWVHDEDCLETDKALNVNTSINSESTEKSLNSLLVSLFSEDNTHELDKEWRRALDYEKGILPVTQANYHGSIIKRFNGNDENTYWSHLFYAKLLRAKIKQKGNDCYTRRLDDVAAYLERHLPRQNGDKEWETRLTLIYLMELSAVCMDWESLGYSERARRVIRDRKYSLTQKYKKCKEYKEKEKAKEACEKAPYEFYELWAGFNIGVAYFHQAHYRKAVQEFNRIIWQVNKWRGTESKANQNFFNHHYGTALLYIPAMFSRSEVQLKLQFAYHTIGTLPNRSPLSEQKKTRAEIIKAQAYQQLGRLGKSWAALKKAGNSLGCGQIGQRTECIIPKPDELNQRFPGLGERFIDILMADHLGWLKLEGEDERKNQKDDLELRYIVKYGNTKNGKPATAKNYEKAVGEASSYLNNLIEIFATYYDVVNNNAYNRSGYFQQLATYLAWLAKASDFECPAPDFACEREEKVASGARKKIANIAIKLYKKAKKDSLLLDEDKQEPRGGCRYCAAKGIDLRRLDADHYTWFTEDMLKFFNSKTVKDILGEETIKKDKKGFIKRLLKREWIDKEDLRIHDLKLRYEYYGEKELLTKLYETEKRKLIAGLSEIEKESLLTELCEKENENRRLLKYAEYYLCQGGLGNQVELSNLPICGNNENQEDSHLTSDDYIKIMQGWDKNYLRQLQSPSLHENQKDSFYFMGLQRWNSASPAKGYSVGGGYLLYHLNKDSKEVDMGIVIDPGFDFVRNLFHMGFSLDDIDIVLISHAHLDHIRDFESIIMLLSELEKSVKREKRVHVILSLGAYRRLKHIVEDPGFRYLLEPYIIDVDREIRDDYLEMLEFRFKPADNNKKHENSNRTANDGKKGNTKLIERFRAVLPTEGDPTDCLWARITPTRAYHDDKTNYSDSFGFKIELNEKVKKPDGEDEPVKFGYTGDTKWVYPDMPDPLKREGRKIEDIAEQYKECDVLLVHLGSLVGKDKDNNDELSFTQYDQCHKNKYRCEELVRDKDHPYLIGMLRLLSSYYKCVLGDEDKDKPLVLVSEFGEELRGTIRSDLIQRLQKIYKNKLAFLPVDVGLNIQMGKKDGVKGDSRDNRCACKVWCVQCDHFVNIGDAEFKLYGTDHALYCVCKTCRKATPINVLQDRLRQLYEVGIELRTNDNK